MKISGTITLLILMLLLGVGQVSAQSTRVLNGVTESFIGGNSDKLASFFDNRVEIIMNGSSKVYSKAQARYVMRDFFADHPSASFSKHTVGRSDNTVYLLGTYKSGRGNYSVDVYIRVFGGSEGSVHQLRLQRR